MTMLQQGSANCLCVLTENVIEMKISRILRALMLTVIIWTLIYLEKWRLYRNHNVAVAHAQGLVSNLG